MKKNNTDKVETESGEESIKYTSLISQKININIDSNKEIVLLPYQSIELEKSNITNNIENQIKKLIENKSIKRVL